MKGLPANELTLNLLEEHLPSSDRAEELVQLLQTWIDEEDPMGQQEPGNDLLHALDEHRPSHRKLFPPELEGKTW